MGVNPVTFDFNGKLTTHFRPGVYSDTKFIDSTGGTASFNNGIILGEALGGEPNQIYSFSSVGEAEETLKRGALLEAVRCCFNPGGGYKPQRVMAMAINKKTRAFSAVEDNGGAEIFRVLAKDYGVEGNTFGLSITAKSDESPQKAVIYKNDQVIWEKEFEKRVFTLSLPQEGTAEAGTLTVNSDSVVVNVGTESKTFSFENYAIIADIVEGMKTMGVVVEMESVDVKLEASGILDCVTGLNFSKSSSTTIYADTAHLVSLLDSSGIVLVEKTEGYRNSLSYSDEIKRLTGGTNGGCTAVDFAQALEVLEGKDIQFITTPSTSFAVALLLKDHCERMNGREGKAERQFLIGHSWGLSTEEVIDLSLSIGTKYGALLSPGFVDYDPSDVERKRTKSFDSGYLAAKEMGRLMAMSVNEPATFKEIGCIALEKIYRSSELDRLIRSGVWCAEVSKKGVTRNVRSVTMNTGSNLMECEFCVVREALWMQRDIREAIEESIVGRAGVEGIEATIMSIVLSKINYYKDSVKSIRAFEEDSIVIKVDGDKYEVEWMGCPTLPINFVFSKNQFVVYRSAGSLGN